MNDQADFVDAVTIREERIGDHETIAAVVTAAFGEAGEAQLVEAIRASDEYQPDLALVACQGETVVGHVMVSHCHLVDGSGRHQVAVLAPLAVAPSHQGQGIGSALVREVIRRAELSGEPLVVLEGSPEYYGRFGFQHAAAFGIVIDLPSWAPPEAGQVMLLTAYRPSIRGRVVYPAAFDVLPAP